jgi:oligopeptide/dipeptide ABC transporter ATP-binding protein
MALISDLQHELGMSVLFISHDLNLAANYADRIAVMYSGKIVEEISATDVFGGLRMRYSRALIDSLPDPDAPPHEALPAIRGVRPDPLDLPLGCRFHPRCDFAVAECASTEPPLLTDELGHSWACWNPASSANDHTVEDA